MAFVAGSAAATPESPDPPSHVVVEVSSWAEFFEDSSYTWNANINVSFTLSDDDPDQVEGEFTYTLYGARADGTPYAAGAGCVAPLYIQVDNSTCAGLVGFLGNATAGSPGYPVPGRAGWVYGLMNGVLGTNFDEDWNVTLYAAAYNITSGRVGAPSCAVVVSFPEAKQVGSRGFTSYNDTLLQAGHSECGDAIEPPSGVAALVTSQYGVSTPSRTNVSWGLSEDDPEQTVGEFEYWTFYRSTTERPDEATYVGVSTPVGVTYRLVNLSGGVGKSDPLYIEMIARDNLTHQRSELSCVVFVQVGQVYSADGCGTKSASDGGVTAGDPSFPGADVPALAAAMGLSTEALALVLGGLMMLATAFAGFLYANTVGGVVGGVLGLGLSVALSLFGSWLVVVAFMLVVVAIVAKLRGGGGE